jgi:cysteine sulfinate desulfinase/cysteine desulfurase-like protein
MNYVELSTNLAQQSSQSTTTSILPYNTSLIVLTHVCARNGEIMDIAAFKRLLDTFVIDDGTSNTRTALHNVGAPSGRALAHRPLLVIDATQSIMKVPIEMEKWGVFGVFFSMHKIGGDQGSGVFVVAPPIWAPFKPLIAGNQQHQLRGGTYNLNTMLIHEDVFDEFDDYNIRVKRWKDAARKIEASGLQVYKPSGKHLYNTLLINIKGCPLAPIHELAEKGIYVGNVSACRNEIEKPIMGGSSEPYLVGGVKEPNTVQSIRISFLDPSELTDTILDTIIETCKETFE